MLSRDELAKLIFQGDKQKLQKRLAPLSEQERAVLLPGCWTLATRFDSCNVTGSGTGIYQFFAGDNAPLLEHVKNHKSLYAIEDCFEVALLALGKFQHVEGIAPYECEPRSAMTWLAVLEDRRPNWANKWLNHVFDTMNPYLRPETLNYLFDQEICDRPTSPGYLAWFAHQAYIMPTGCGASTVDEVPFFRDVLMKDDGFLHDVWKLFKVDVPMFLDHTDQWDPAGKKDSVKMMPSWAEILRALTERGRLDRRKVLEATLDSLSLPLSKDRIGGVISFHKGMTFTDEDRGKCQRRYVKLLDAENGRVANFALKEIKALEKSGHLKHALLLEVAAKVFPGEEEEPTKSLLSWLDQIAKQNPKLTPTLFPALVEGLIVHPRPANREVALRLLEKWVAATDDVLRKTLMKRVSDAVDLSTMLGGEPKADLVLIRDLLAGDGKGIGITESLDKKANALADLPEQIQDDILGEIKLTTHDPNYFESCIYEVRVKKSDSKYVTEPDGVVLWLTPDANGNLEPAMEKARNLIKNHVQLFEKIVHHVAGAALEQYNNPWYERPPMTEQGIRDDLSVFLGQFNASPVYTISLASIGEYLGEDGIVVELDENGEICDWYLQ